MNLLLIEKAHERDIINNIYQHINRIFMSLFDKKMLDFPYTFGERIFILQESNLLKDKLKSYIIDKIEEVKGYKKKWEIFLILGISERTNKLIVTIFE